MTLKTVIRFYFALAMLFSIIYVCYTNKFNFMYGVCLKTIGISLIYFFILLINFIKKRIIK